MWLPGKNLFRNPLLPAHGGENCRFSPPTFPASSYWSCPWARWILWNCLEDDYGCSEGLWRLKKYVIVKENNTNGTTCSGTFWPSLTCNSFFDSQDTILFDKRHTNIKNGKKIWQICPQPCGTKIYINYSGQNTRDYNPREESFGHSHSCHHTTQSIFKCRISQFLHFLSSKSTVCWKLVSRHSLPTKAPFSPFKKNWQIITTLPQSKLESMHFSTSKTSSLDPQFLLNLLFSPQNRRGMSCTDLASTGLWAQHLTPNLVRKSWPDRVWDWL